MTARLARWIVADAQVMTLASAARRHQVGWHMVNALVGAWAGLWASVAAPSAAGR
ncbi:hypothetical protein [Candidatus Poriferisodalis sp.]|uniref:hypothetical protein n=1 Tax=Candidatus Poriferisodalis sp. TaxID=3101277 RepID=UPI003AF64524